MERQRQRRISKMIGGGGGYMDATSPRSHASGSSSTHYSSDEQNALLGRTPSTGGTSVSGPGYVVRSNQQVRGRHAAAEEGTDLLLDVEDHKQFMSV
jgi:hypothetical protein